MKKVKKNLFRKGPKIKKAQKYGLWPYSADPLPPNLNYGLFT